MTTIHAGAADRAYDVNTAIERHVARSTTPDPRRIAEAVAEAIPPEQLRATLAQVLVLVVQRDLHARRRSEPTMLPQVGEPGPRRYAPADAPVCVGHNRWKALREATRADLRSMANWQGRRMVIIRAELDVYEGLYAALVRTGGQRVGDLDEEVIDRIAR